MAYWQQSQEQDMIAPYHFRLRMTVLGIDVCNNSQQEIITEVHTEQWKKAAAG
jgi:hypothetical protein